MNNPYAFMANMFRPAFLALYAVGLLAIFGYSRVFIPASFFSYPFGIVYFLLPGAVLAAWVLRTSRGNLRFDWKWVFLSIIVAGLFWASIAKGAGWIITQATGASYDEAFPLERNIKHVTKKEYYSSDILGTKCLQRLQGEVLDNTLPQYLCLQGTDYARLADGPQPVRLHGQIGWFGRSIDGYALQGQ